MSGHLVWPVSPGAPLATQLAELAAALRFAARNPDMLNLERLTYDVERMRDTARRQEECLDGIVADHAAAERANAALARAQHKASELAL